VDRPSARIGSAASRETAYILAMERLVLVVQQLSTVRDLEALMAVVRKAAREITGADGATFVLREDGHCLYADEDAIAPLWKGKRFPLSACISGWSMLNRQAVAIEDIYSDPRIPADAYRPTFVKSLVMVPIRTVDPVGAIGNYWARPHRATPEEVRVLQALADSTSVAMESVTLYAELEKRVRERTAELADANRELEAFTFTVSHDLRTPLQAVLGFGELLAESAGGRLAGKEREYVAEICGGARRMASLIDGLMSFSRAQHGEIRREPVDLSALAGEVGRALALAHPDRPVHFEVQGGLRATGDPFLLRVLLDNLVGNAWKYSSKTARPEVSFGAEEEGGETTYFVRDNGAGFEMAAAGRIFEPFQRLHTSMEFPGTGIGLATVHRIVERHGGRIRAEGRPGAGATFRWTLPAPPRG
jgi:signal transduction histidine kinase